MTPQEKYDALIKCQTLLVKHKWWMSQIKVMWILLCGVLLADAFKMWELGLAIFIVQASFGVFSVLRSGYLLRRANHYLDLAR